ncbi:MAG: tetratricopeptide repeat protein, partial [Candidatus Eiseniibacteriota bacterium]
MPSRPLRFAAVLLALMVVDAGSSWAQSYARFDVPDSMLAGALRASGRGYEVSWNTLLVAELRSALGRDPSAKALAQLESRIAAAEPGALGSTIAPDAVELRRRWSAGEARLRLAAWDAESLGVEANDARRFAVAESLYRAALERYRKLGETRRSAWLLGSLGVNAFDAEDFASADSFYVEALAARRALGDARMIGASLNALGGTHIQLGRPADAYPYLVAALQIREQLGDQRGIGATLNALASAQGELGRADSARATYAQALEHATAAADSDNVQVIVTNLARLTLDGGDAERSAAYATRGIPIAEGSGDAPGVALLELHLGRAYAQQGRYADAAERFDRALDQSLAIGDPRGELAVRIQQGRLGIELQDSKGARAPLERAVALADSLGDRLLSSHALSNLAIVCRLEGDGARARTLAERAAQAGVDAGDSLAVRGVAVTLGQLAIDRGDAAGAGAWFERAAQAIAHPTLEQALADQINLGAAASNLGKLDEAEQRFQGAESQAAAAGATELLWPAWLGLGDVAERRAHYADALGWDRRAASLIDTLRARQGSQGASIVLLSRRLFAFEALIHLLGKLAPQFPDSNYDAEAFDWAERVRARAFLDLLNARGLSGQRITPVSLDQARDALPTGHSALLEYSLGDSSSSLWVVTRNSWVRLPLPPGPVLRSRAEMLRGALADPAAADGRSARSAARALYKLLIAPAEPALIGVDQLIVSPDGALSRIPFEALLAADAPADAGPDAAV